MCACVTVFSSITGRSASIAGRDVTPFVLGRVNELSAGKSLAASIQTSDVFRVFFCLLELLHYAPECLDEGTCILQFLTSPDYFWSHSILFLAGNIEVPRPLRAGCTEKYVSAAEVTDWPRTRQHQHDMQ